MLLGISPRPNFFYFLSLRFARGTRAASARGAEGTVSLREILGGADPPFGGGWSRESAVRKSVARAERAKRKEEIRRIKGRMARRAKDV